MSDAVTDLLAEYDRFEAEGGVAVVERDVVTVTGPDAGRYLQGQLSQEVVALPGGASTWSLVLQPTGKVDAWLRVTRSSDEEYVLDVDAGFGDALVARLSRFLLRTKAEIGAPERRPMLARRRGALPPSRSPAMTRTAGSSPPPPGPVWRDPTSCRRRGPTSRRRRPSPRRPTSGTGSPTASRRWAPSSPGTPSRRRPERGCIDASVSFTKGCYTGQELVARIDSRGGNVPRPVRLLVIEGEVPVVPGADVRVDGQPVGTVTSSTPPLSAGHPGLALAPLARSVAPGTIVEVATVEGWTAAGVVEPPFVGHGPD